MLGSIRTQTEIFPDAPEKMVFVFCPVIRAEVSNFHQGSREV